MNARIMLSLLTIGVAAMGTGYATFAFFSDTETSEGNIFTTGSLDLTLNGLNGVTGTLSGANLAPLDTVAGSLRLRNEGTIHHGDAQGHAVDLDLKAVVSDIDDPGNPADPDDGGPSPVPLSRFLVLTTLAYGGDSLLGAIGDADGDGRAHTLADLRARGRLADLADPLAAGRTLDLAVQFAPGGGNDLKRDAVQVDFVFFLAMAGDPDLA